MSIRKNTIYNLGGTVFPLMVSLITIPIYMEVVGESRYGVLAIAWLLLGYFGLFDLGLGRATAQRIAKLPESQKNERAETFWTALALNTALGLAGALIMWALAHYFFNNHFSIDAALKPEVMGSVGWLALAVPVATMSGVLSGTLQGLSKFLELNLFSFAGSVLLQVIPLIVAVNYGPDLAWLIPATIATRFCIAGVLFQRCYSHVLAKARFSVSKSLSRKLLQFGGWITVSSVIGPMMVILDRFVIGALLGAKYVTFYTVPFQLAQRTNVIPIALSSALFPRLAQTGLDENGRALTDMALRSLAVIITPIFVLAIFMVDPFLTLWLGKKFAHEASFAAQILLLGFWGNAVARIPHALLQAAGKPDVVAKCHLAELAPYFLLLYLGLEYFGIAGAAIAFSVRAIVDSAILLHCAGTLKLSINLLTTPIVLVISSVFFASYSFPSWMVSIWAVLLLGVCAFWALRTMPEQLADVIGRYSPKVINQYFSKK